MAVEQLARGLWTGWAPTENPFNTPNGMDANLRTLDDHMALYTLQPPIAVGTPLPVTAGNGDGQIFINGSYAIFNAGSWQIYGPRKGIMFMSTDASESWQCNGTGWTKASVLDVQPAIAAARATVEPLVQRAEDAAQVATSQSNPFPTIAAGIAGTANGQFFTVYTGGTDNLKRSSIFKNNAGVAKLIQELIPGTEFDGLSSELADFSRVVGYASALPFPPASAAVTGGTFVFAQQVAQSLTLSRLTMSAAIAGVITLSAWTRAGDTFTRTRSVDIQVGAGQQTLQINFPVMAGEYVGVFGPNIIHYGLGGAEGWYNGVGNQFVDSTSESNSRLFVLLETSTPSRIGKLEGQIANAVTTQDLDELTTKVGIQIGQQAPIPDGNWDVSWGSMFAMEQAAPWRGTVSRVAFRTSAAGDFRAMVFKRTGNLFEVVQEVVLHAPAAGPHEFETNLPIEEGQHVGFRTAVGRYQTGTTEQYGWFGGSGTTSFVDDTVSRNSRLLVGFRLEHRRLAAVAGMSRPEGLPFESALIIGMGQSLMEGSQTPTSGTSPITTVQEYDSVGFPAYPAAPTSIAPATVANTQRSGSRGEWPGLGAAASVRQRLLANNNISYRDVKSTLVIANNAVGGSPIANISKGTAPYNSAVAQATALAGLTGDKAGVMAVIYGQGESDGVLTREQYREALIKLATDLDADLRAATGQAKQVPLIAYQLATARRDISLAQLDAARKSPLVSIACAMYPFTYYDTQHVDSISSRRMGGYYGAAVKRIAVDGGRWEALWPIDCRVDGNFITLTFNKSGLQFDVNLVPVQSNYGFWVSSGSGPVQTINSIVVLNSNQVRIECAQAPQPGWTVNYGINAVNMAPFTGRAGNLRDCAGDVLQFDNYPLHNWCLGFDWTI